MNRLFDRIAAFVMPNRTQRASHAGRILSGHAKLCAVTVADRERARKRAWHRAYREQFNMVPDPRLDD